MPPKKTKQKKILFPDEGAIHTDLRGNIKSLDPAAEELFGFSSKEAAGQFVSTVLVWPGLFGISESQNGKQTAKKSTNSGAKPEPGIGKRKDGTSFPAEITVKRTRKDNRHLYSVHARNLSKSSSIDEKLQALTQRQKAMSELGIRVSTALNTREAAQAIVETAIQAADAEISRIFLLQDNNKFRLTAGAASEKLPNIEQADSYLEFETGQGLSGWTVEKGERVVMDDARNDPHWVSSPWAVQLGLKSYAALPIRRGEKIIGVFSVLRVGIRPFEKEDLEMLDILSSYAAIALEKIHLIEEGRRYASRLEIVDEIAKAVGSALEPEKLFHTIIQEIRRAVPCERCIVASINPDTKEPHVWHAYSEFEIDPDPSKKTFGDGKSIYNNIYKTKAPMNISDSRQYDFPWAKQLVKAGIFSVLWIPIIQNDQCVAHVTLSHREPEAFTDEHEKLLIGIAGHMGSAIRNAVLFQEAEERASRLEIVDRIAKAIGSTLEPKELFRTIVQEIRNVVPCDRCSIATVDPTTLRRRYWHIDSDFDIPEPTHMDELEGGKRLLDFIYTPKTSLISNTPTDIPWPHLKDNGIQSSLVIPILLDDECVAHIALSSKKTEAFNRMQQDLLRDVAAHLGSAILNATLYQTSEDRASRLEMLQDLTRKLNEDIDLSDRLARIADGSKILLGASSCVVLVQQDKSTDNKLLYSRGLSQNYLDQITNNFDKTLIPEVHKTRKPITISDIFNDPRYPFPIELAAKEDIASLLIVPLIYKENAFGTISFHWETTGTITDADIAMAKAFADQAAIAIEIARLFRETEEHGRRMGTLVEVAQRLTRGLDLTEVLSGITDATALVFGGEAGIRLREGNELVIAAGTSKAMQQMTKPSILIGEGIAGEAAETGKPAFATDISKDGRSIKEEVALADLGRTGSQLSVPLRLELRNLGVFNIYRERGHVFTEEELKLATSLADQAAVAIENARLYQEAEKRGKRLETLVEVAQRLTRGLDLPDVLNTITEAAAGVFEGESAIRIREGDELIWTTGTQKAYSLPFKKRLHIGESLSGQAALTGEPIRVPDFLDDNRVIPAHRKIQMANELKSMMIIPLVLETRVVGVLNIFRERGYIFDEEALRIGSTLADQAAIAIENARLFEQVQERTEEMEKAKNQAETINNAKSEFLSNMSHELRSPLNAVLGFSDLLLMMVKEEKLIDIASKIRDSGKHITRLIEDLLDLDRIGSGKVSLDLEDVTINSLLEKIVKIRSDQLPEGFFLKTNFDAQCGNVTCDPLRITQITTNLLDNAVKYSPDGGTIRLKTEAVSGEVIITVEDEGLGMTPNEISVIFDRFSQLESGTKGRGSGLGLGLSIVKKLLELHGGRILVKSTKGVGSSFSFVLPMATAKTAAKKNDAPPARDMGVDPWAGKKILVVDDMEQNHEYVKLLMKSASQVFSAYNGQEGVETARREQPDIIFMDLRMPVLDGFEAIEKLKIEADTKEIPVLAVTAQAMKADRDRCIRLGVSGFITKPIEIVDFRNAIQEILS